MAVAGLDQDSQLLSSWCFRPTSNASTSLRSPVSGAEVRQVGAWFAVSPGRIDHRAEWPEQSVDTETQLGCR